MNQEEIKEWLEWFEANHENVYRDGDFFYHYEPGTDKSLNVLIAYLSGNNRYIEQNDLEFAIREEIKAKGWDYTLWTFLDLQQVKVQIYDWTRDEMGAIQSGITLVTTEADNELRALMQAYRKACQLLPTKVGSLSAKLKHEPT